MLLCNRIDTLEKTCDKLSSAIANIKERNNNLPKVKNKMAYTEKEVIAKLGVARCTLVRWRRGRSVNLIDEYVDCPKYPAKLKYKKDYTYKNNRVYYTQQGFNKIKKLKEKRCRHF